MKASLAWLEHPVVLPDGAAAEGARRRQASLTKPAGSLGRLEELAIWLAGRQGRVRPTIDRVHIAVFAADHGVAAEGVSAFPQSVTVEMLRNFAAGGAAIAVLAKGLGAGLEVIDVGAATDPGPMAGVRAARVGAGSANLAREPAMTEAQLASACQVGLDAVDRARAAGTQLFVGAEMGIANTTAASALGCALLNVPASELVGPGTGLGQDKLRHKAEVIERGLALHGTPESPPLELLRRLGGFEIASLTGAYVACAQGGLPALVDGFIATAAALVATRVNPGVADWLLYAHRSGEPGHSRLLDALAGQPLLALGMRLGEGSGAAAAVPLLRLACQLHGEMATFGEARVSEGGL